VIRLLTRRWTDRMGTRPVALCGLSCLAASLLLFLPVNSEWGLALPAAVSGVAHAVLFPAVISGGGNAFPNRHRGLATTLVLTMFDLGSLLGQPAVGVLLQASRNRGWPAYDVMFVSVAAFMGLVAFVYFCSSTAPAGFRNQRRRASRQDFAGSSAGRPRHQEAPATAPLVHTDR
jgi:MFS family permease